jgi:lipopolysaccharide export system permease protein
VKILSRYLVREHAVPFVFAVLALTGLLVLNQVAKQFPNLIGKGLPWSVIASVFGLSLPFIFAMTLPMAVLVAALHAFSRLGADSEITALRATGVDLVRLIRPVLGAAVVLSLVEFGFVDQVLPRANQRLKGLLIDIARKKPTFELREQVVNEVVPGTLFLRAGRIDEAADRMRDVVIYDLAVAQRRRTIYADSGYIRLNPDHTDLFLTLFDGYVHDYDRGERDTFRRVFFRTDLVRIAGVSNRLERRTDAADFRSDREMTICQMEAAVVSARIAAANGSADRRAAIERDVLALVGIVRPPGDTARPRLPVTPTTLYCSLLERARRAIAPAPLHAEAAPAPQRPRPPFGRRAVTAVTKAGADSAVKPAGAGDTIAAPARPPRPLRGAIMAADPTGEQLRIALASVAAAERSSRQSAASYQVEIHKKFSLAASCLVFVLIGAPVALRFPRGGVGLVIGASFVIFGLYYVGLIGGETLADGLYVPAWAAMWAPNAIMTALGLVLFSRVNRGMVTTRDGGPAELVGRWRARRRERR